MLSGVAGDAIPSGCDHLGAPTGACAMLPIHRHHHCQLCTRCGTCSRASFDRLLTRFQAIPELCLLRQSQCAVPVQIRSTLAVYLLKHGGAYYRERKGNGLHVKYYPRSKPTGVSCQPQIVSDDIGYLRPSDVAAEKCHMGHEATAVSSRPVRINTENGGAPAGSKISATWRTRRAVSTSCSAVQLTSKDA